MRTPLSPCEENAVAAIRLLKHQNKGTPPTFQEIADALSVSKERVRYMVRKLVIKGYVAHDPGKRRNLQLI